MSWTNACRGRRVGAYLSRLRNLVLRPLRRGTCVQLAGGLPDLRRHETLCAGEAAPALRDHFGAGLHDASVFVFDEPSIGLHPLDVQTLLQVFDRLVASGATVLVIEHDLDVIRNADYVIDMGPGGGEQGGGIVAAGTPEEIAFYKESITGTYLFQKGRPS